MNIHSLFPTTERFEITGLATDNRLVKPGDLFICIKGYTVDGHHFAKSAEEAGAVAVVCEERIEALNIPQFIVTDTSAELPRLAHLFFNQPTEHLALFGLTGTNGKTTTAYLLEQLLGGCSHGAGYIGTNGIRYADQFIEPKNTTPEPLSLQRIFDDMVQKGVSNVAIEVSSHALELHRVDCCRFKVALFTNLTPEHLDFHPTMDDYFEAKYKLFQQLRPDGVGIVNVDDPYGQLLVSRLRNQGVQTLTFGIEETADFMAHDIQMTAKGTQFSLQTPTGSSLVSIPLLGKFNVSNLLGAVASAYASGLTFEQIVQQIKKLKPVDGRMELIHEGQDFTVIVDYAHTPDGVEKVLSFAKDIKETDVKVVIGCPGDRDRTKRPVMAQLSVDYADDVIFTTDDPHSECPEAILDEMVVNLPRHTYQRITDRTKAIEQAILTAQPKDIIIIAGRGHEKIQYWSGRHIELDDREVARQMILKKLNRSA